MSSSYSKRCCFSREILRINYQRQQKSIQIYVYAYLCTCRNTYSPTCTHTHTHTHTHYILKSGTKELAQMLRQNWLLLQSTVLTTPFPKHPHGSSQPSVTPGPWNMTHSWLTWVSGKNWFIDVQAPPPKKNHMRKITKHFLKERKP